MIPTLFICQGNMVRSQIAEAFYNKYRDGGAISAGILPSAEHRDGMRLGDLGMEEWIRILMEKEGIDIADNICKQVTETMVAEAKRIVVMARREIWPEYLARRSNVIVWADVADDGGERRISDTIDVLKGLVLSL